MTLPLSGKFQYPVSKPRPFTTGEATLSSPAGTRRGRDTVTIYKACVNRHGNIFRRGVASAAVPLSGILPDDGGGRGGMHQQAGQDVISISP